MAFVTKAPLVALIALVTLLPSNAQAQNERLRVSFGPAAATGAGDANLALNGSFGYRFSERFWFEADVTAIDGPADRFGERLMQVDGRSIGTARVGDLIARGSRLFGGAGRPFAGPGSGGPIGPGFDSLPALTTGQTLVGTIGLRYELPIQGERFRPYLTGGLGLARTEEEFALMRFASTDRIDRSVSHTGIAASGGVGASLRMYRQLFADVDARYFRLARDRNMVRFGGGVSLRF